YFDVAVAPQQVPAPDTTPPVISCHPPSGWQTGNVTVGCTASDAGSGLANAADTKFTLTTAVPSGVATATAATDARTVCDVVGNCAAAGPVTGLQIDPVAPSVSCAPSPASWSATNESVACIASDADSGLANSSDASFQLSTTVASGASSDAAAFSTHAPV